jgi:hypothetical protein
MSGLREADPVVSWFSETIEGPIKDMHIVHVFTPAWKASSPPRYHSIRNQELFNDPQRWINLECMSTRARTEERETARLRNSDQRFLPLGKKRSVKAANGCYSSNSPQGHKLCQQPPREDVRWTAQCISTERKEEEGRDFKPHGFFDELLYRLYAKNLDIFGDKAARELYVFDIGRAANVQLKYTIKQKDTEERDCAAHQKGADEFKETAEAGPVRTGKVRLRLYALLKELAYPPLDDFNHTFFSPFIVLAAVISPVYDPGDEIQAAAIRQVFDLSLDLDDALFEACEKECPGRGTRLDDFMICQAHGLGRHLNIDWARLTRPPLTQFSVFVIGLDDVEIPQRFLCDPAAPLEPSTVACSRSRWRTQFLDYAARSWRTQFLHYIARVCALGFQITAEPGGLWSRAQQSLRCEQEFADLDLRKLTKKYLPRRSSVSVRSDMVGVVAPGRKILVHNLSAAQICEFNERRYEKNGDFSINGDYTRRDVLDSVARNVLLCSLVTSQEALLSRFHSVISEDGDITEVKADLKEFDNFYDVDLFDLPNGAFYQDAFNDLKHAFDLDHQYKMLLTKLEITVSNIHAENLKWAIVAFLFGAFMALRFDEHWKLIIIAAFSSIAVGLVIVRPGWSQMKLLCKKLGRWIIYAPALIGEWRDTRAHL